MKIEKMKERADLREMKRIQNSKISKKTGARLYPIFDRNGKKIFVTIPGAE